MTASIQAPVVDATIKWQDADRYGPGGWLVRTTWSAPDLDRTDGYGWLISNKATARRLVKAIKAGVVFYDIQVATDVNGRSYVAATARVLGRRANADLRRLGF